MLSFWGCFGRPSVCDGLWVVFADETCANNGVSTVELAEAIHKALRMGGGKGRTVVLVGETTSRGGRPRSVVSACSFLRSFLRCVVSACAWLARGCRSGKLSRHVSWSPRRGRRRARSVFSPCRCGLCFFSLCVPAVSIFPLFFCGPTARKR